MNNKTVSIVIGSWGSYNACNERALGSKWLDLSDYSDWDEIAVELTKQGFKIDGIDEELFIQDEEGLPSGCTNWDYTHPKNLFETLYESDVLDEEHKFETMLAYIEVRSYDDWAKLVESKGSRWDDDIYLYVGYDWSDYGREIFECCEVNIDDRLLDFFDFEAYGRYMGSGCVDEYSNGIIEIIE